METKFEKYWDVIHGIMAVATVLDPSASGRFLSPHRSRLQPKTLEALMCIQNWLGAKIQGSNDLAYYAFNEDNDMNEVENGG
ncbi:hypothetical protein Dsin_007507 [Dipteronia sinensis]|uniref:HAT C-terminal dimerisation domain-containing protein n=1 Tax=Dipteronia sinensis TaxID=43782 RepID=A0AAE0B1B1_9ROSI|nr:hypothetical protein Dsin_007507 [Dipteronia sinensis]